MRDDLFPEEVDKNIESDSNVPRLSYGHAYLLWFFLGWMGAHRFYARKWFSGICYFISFGFFGFGWALDLFLTYPMVTEAQRRLEREAKEIPELFEKAPLAPWAEKAGEGFWESIQFPLRLGLFILAPFLFMFFAILMQQFQLIVIFVLILIVTGFTSSADRILKKYESLEKVPLAGDALDTIKKLRDYYFHNKPRAFLFYLFYPICGTLAMPFSKSVRKEFKLYMKIFAPIALFFAAEMLIKCFFMEYLAKEALFGILFAYVFMICVIVLMFMLPMIATSFTMSLSGKQKSLKVLTIVAFIITVGIGIFGYQQERDVIGFFTSDILKNRMENKKFVEEFCESTHLFLSYYIPRASEVDSIMKKDKLLTKKYRRHIQGLAVEDQSRPFEIVKFFDAGGNIWGGVIMDLGQAQRIPLFLYNANNAQLYKSWKNVPYTVTSMFKINKIRVRDKKTQKIIPHIITKKLLINDYHRSLLRK